MEVGNRVRKLGYIGETIARGQILEIDRQDRSAIVRWDAPEGAVNGRTITNRIWFEDLRPD